MSKPILMLLLGAAVCTAQITYNTDLTVGSGSLKGTITTDGTIGGLAPSLGHITGFDLTIFDGVNTAEIVDGVGGAGYAWFGPSAGITASATQLTFDFSGNTDALFQYNISGGGGSFVCFETSNPCSGLGMGISLGASSSPGAGDQFENQQHVTERGVQVIATVQSAVPEPSSVALFGTGIGTLALFGMRRRRRA